MWLVLCKKGLNVRLRFALFGDLSIMICKPLKSAVNSKHLFPWCLENPYAFTLRNTVLQCLTGIIPSGLLGICFMGLIFVDRMGRSLCTYPPVNTQSELSAFLLLLFLPTLSFSLRVHFLSFRRCELGVHTQPFAAVHFSSPCLY